MAKLTIIDAEGIANRNRPWTIRLEYHGSNPNNASGVSDKYWYATGRGITEAVECGWGAVGAVPALQLIDWPELHKRVAEKQAKGYDWAETPFIRMSAGALATIAANAPHAGGQFVAPPSAPMIPTPTVIPTAGKRMVAPAKLASLGAPYNTIVALKVLRVATKMVGYMAVDADGDDVLEMDALNGLDFAQKYDVEIVFQ